MSRLTKNISDKQTYCGYEVKDCKYQQIYGFKKYSELEDYVDCDLTLAIDKLGKLEDLEEQLGCPLEMVVKAIKYGIYYTSENNGKIFLEGSFKLYHYSSGWCLIKPKFHFYLEDYKKTWWLKWDKSE